MILTMFLLLRILIPLNARFKAIIGKIIAFYIKLFFSYPNFLFRKMGAYTIKILNILNNGINFTLANLMLIEPLKLIAKNMMK